MGSWRRQNSIRESKSCGHRSRTALTYSRSPLIFWTRRRRTQERKTLNSTVMELPKYQRPTAIAHPLILDMVPTHFLVDSAFQTLISSQLKSILQSTTTLSDNLVLMIFRNGSQISMKVEKLSSTVLALAFSLLFAMPSSFTGSLHWSFGYQLLPWALVS